MRSVNNEKPVRLDRNSAEEMDMVYEKVSEDKRVPQELEFWGSGRETNCPQCSAPIRKTSGSLVTTCAVCSKPFCFICKKDVRMHRETEFSENLLFRCPLEHFEKQRKS